MARFFVRISFNSPMILVKTSIRIIGELKVMASFSRDTLSDWKTRQKCPALRQNRLPLNRSDKRP
jgi:hypothetical protein